MSSSLEDRRQAASASKGIEGFAYNRQILKWNPRGFEAQPLIRKKQSRILKTICELGPLTIEEVSMINDKRGYKMSARTCKRASLADLQALKIVLDKELQRRGVYTKKNSTERSKRSYQKHKVEICAALRAKRAEQRALKIAMQNLPTKQ